MVSFDDLWLQPVGILKVTSEKITSILIVEIRFFIIYYFKVSLLILLS
jgi:hypothetical protein